MTAIEWVLALLLVWIHAALRDGCMPGKFAAVMSSLLFGMLVYYHL